MSCLHFTGLKVLRGKGKLNSHFICQTLAFCPFYHIVIT